MIKVFLMVFGPGPAWDRIALARRGYFYILTTYLIPTLLLVTVVEGFGLLKWGKWQSTFSRMHQFPAHTIFAFEVLQFFALAATVFISALLVLKIAQTFHTRNNFLQAFTVVAYGFGPLFFLSLFDALPVVNPWIPWILGILVTIWIFYQGLPRVLQPDPTHAFGLYLASSVVVILVTGVVRAVTALYLLGQVDVSHSWLGQKIGEILPQ